MCPLDSAPSMRISVRKQTRQQLGVREQREAEALHQLVHSSVWLDHLHRPRLAGTPRRHMTHIIPLNTRIPTRLTLLTDLAALARRRTLRLLHLTEGIQSR